VAAATVSRAVAMAEEQGAGQPSDRECRRDRYHDAGEHEPQAVLQGHTEHIGPRRAHDHADPDLVAPRQDEARDENAD
jgi:hypothetical protein